MAAKYSTPEKKTGENSLTPEKASTSGNKPSLEMEPTGEKKRTPEKKGTGEDNPIPQNKPSTSNPNASKSISEFESYYDYYFNSIDEIIEFLPERFKKCPVEIIHYRPNGAVLPIIFTRIMRRGQYAVVYLLSDPAGGENHVVLASLTESNKTFM